jgi:hypothetical protein
LALSVVTVVAACDNVLSPGEVRIRVENASALDFTSTIVGFPQQTEDYGAVGAGQASEYRTIGQAYRYAYFEVAAGGRRYVLQPIDYVGEELLEEGSYTYQLTPDPQTQSMTFRLVEN